MRAEVGQPCGAIDIFRWEEYWGVRLWYADLPEVIRAAADRTYRIILLSKDIDASEERFLFAHELSEILYPSLNGYHGRFYNEFAGHLVAPPPVLYELWMNQWTVGELANEFGVTISVVLYQLRLMAPVYGFTL